MQTVTARQLDQGAGSARMIRSIPRQRALGVSGRRRQRMVVRHQPDGDAAAAKAARNSEAPVGAPQNQGAGNVMSQFSVHARRHDGAAVLKMKSKSRQHLFFSGEHRRVFAVVGAVAPIWLPGEQGLRQVARRIAGAGDKAHQRAIALTALDPTKCNPGTLNSKPRTTTASRWRGEPVRAVPAPSRRACRHRCGIRSRRTWSNSDAPLSNCSRTPAFAALAATMFSTVTGPPPQTATSARRWRPAAGNAR